MAAKKTHFAVDLTPEGVNLWQRGQNGGWLGLGFSSLKDTNFALRIEDLRQSTSQPSTLAEIRIPAGDVFVTQIRVSDLPNPVTNASVLDLIADDLPFKGDRDQVSLDICERGSGRLSVAAVPNTVLKTTRDFARSLGFEPCYITSVLDPMQFPRDPKFELSKPTPLRPAVRVTTNRTLKLATIAGVALCLVGAFLVRAAVVSDTNASSPMAVALTKPQTNLPEVRSLTAPTVTAVTAIESPSPQATFQPETTAKIIVPEPVAEPVSPLTNPQHVPSRVFSAPDTVDLTIKLAAFAPDTPDLPKAVVEFAVIEDEDLTTQQLAKPALRESIFNRKASQNFTQTHGRQSFGTGGLTTTTRKLLINPLVSIEQPNDGSTGRKSIRILPTDTEEGAWNSRFDVDRFVRFAQVETANDALPGTDASDTIIPLGENAEIKETTTAGTPIYAGPPAAVPPARTDQTPVPPVPAPAEAGSAATDTAGTTSTDQPADASVDISEFTAEIESVLEQSPNSDAIVEGATNTIEAAQDPEPEPETAALPSAQTTLVGSNINTPDANTTRPRPRPDTLKTTLVEIQKPEVGQESGQPIRRAGATTIRPKPRPIGMDRAADAQAVEQAVTAAIAAGTGTSQAVFISRIPKARPANMRAVVDRTKARLTTASLGPNAVVRTAPKGVEKGSNELTTSNTSQSVAELATERARLSKSSMNLIGVYGSASSRRALLRLGSGRYVKVKAGDKVSGWKVSAIGESSVRIDKGKRNQVLRMPE